VADVDVNITMRAAGGSESAGEIQKAETAVTNLTSSSNALQNQFQRRFQHIGLMLFAGDALRASGLGMEARQVIVLLNTALTEGATAAGLSSGGIMLIVTALAALVGIAAKVIEHHKTMEEQTKKQLEQDTKTLENIREQIGELDKYAVNVGHLNKVQKDYLDTLKAIGAEEAKKKNEDLIDRIAQLNLSIVKEKEELQQVTLFHNALKGGEMGKAVEDSTKKLNDMILELHKAEVDMNALHKTGTGTFKDMAKSAETAAEAHKKAAEKIKSEHEKAAAASSKAWDEHSREMEKRMQEEGEFVGKVADRIGGDLGNAFAKSLVEGKSFTDQMKAAFRNMAEQIIADIVRIMVKWAALSAMGFPVGGGAVGGFGHLLGFATGGQVMVDRPTLFLAGEAGPEMATFTPLSASASTSTGGSRGGDVYNVSMPITVSGVNDPDRLASLIGPKIINNIRGAGQVNFTRNS